MQELSEYRFSTIIGSDEGYIYAGTFGQGILLAAYKGNVFACSNKGLFKMVMLQDRPLLQSLGIHCAVTDIIFADTHMLIATLDQGILKNLFEEEL